MSLLALVREAARPVEFPGLPSMYGIGASMLSRNVADRVRSVVAGEVRFSGLLVWAPEVESEEIAELQARAQMEVYVDRGAGWAARSLGVGVEFPMRPMHWREYPTGLTVPSTPMRPEAMCDLGNDVIVYPELRLVVGWRVYERRYRDGLWLPLLSNGRRVDERPGFVRIVPQKRLIGSADDWRYTNG